MFHKTKITNSYRRRNWRYAKENLENICRK